MKKIITITVLMMLALCEVAQAGTFARYGLGIARSAEYGNSNVKSFSIGYTDPIIGPIIYQTEVGYYNDASGHGRRGSGFGNAGLGLEVDPGVFVFRSVWGVGGITTPDTMLGGRFQFNHDFLIGVRGQNGALIGANLKHISSAGLNRPNLGRDFLLLHAELPF